jgi:hypothetical protein
MPCRLAERKPLFKKGLFLTPVKVVDAEVVLEVLEGFSPAWQQGPEATQTITSPMHEHRAGSLEQS